MTQRDRAPRGRGDKFSIHAPGLRDLYYPLSAPDGLQSELCGIPRLAVGFKPMTVSVSSAVQRSNRIPSTVFFRVLSREQKARDVAGLPRILPSDAEEVFERGPFLLLIWPSEVHARGP